MRVLHFLQPHGNQGGDPLDHVVELAQAQVANGHQLGIIHIDDGTGFINMDRLDKMSKFCTLGITRIVIDQRTAFSRNRTLFPAYAKATSFAQDLSPDILHGHGATGGVLARHVQKKIHRKARCICLYSPHDALWRSLGAPWPLAHSEKKLWKHTNGIIFQNTHIQESYIKRFGPPPCPTRMIHEGLGKGAFAPRQMIDMATDFLFVGEISKMQGVHILVKALSRMQKDHTTGALVVGSGPQEKELRSQVSRYNLSHEIFFNAPLPARTAFLKGGCLVLPATNSVPPYIFMQAAAAGVPMILTNVGAIPEIIGDIEMPLIVPNNTNALQKQMSAYLTDPHPFMDRASALQQRFAKHFTLARMSHEVEEFYMSLAHKPR